MIEIKLSQGAKPGHGGMLAGSEGQTEIAEIRGVEAGKDCLSPPTHIGIRHAARAARIRRPPARAVRRQAGRLQAVHRQRSEFMGICKAMLETGIKPDFITIDGAEGGTGAAPVELSDRVGMMLDEALPFAHSVLDRLGSAQGHRA